MRKLEKTVIAVILIMCLLFSEFATLISHALEADEKIEPNLVEDYKSKLYENYYSDKTNEFKYVVNKNILVACKENISSILLEDENDAFSLNNEKIYLEDSVYYSSIRILKDDFNEILGEKGNIELYDENEKLIGEINSDSEDGKYYIYIFKKMYETISYKITPAEKEGDIELIIQKTIKSNIVEKLDYETLREIKQIETNTKLSYVLEDEELSEPENLLDVINLKEPVTDIDLIISEDTIYTLEENKINFTLILKNTSYVNELFENPIIEIELPEEIEEAKINKVMMLYKNGLSISKWDVKDENSRKYLYIELDGTQTEYQNSSIIDGTNIIIETTLKAYETTPIKESTIKLRYENSDRNINYLQEEKDSEEYDIQFMSKYGLLTLNGIENLSIENEKELAIGENLETIELDIETDAQILNHEMAIVNNYTESLENVEIIGSIPTENNEKLLEQEFKNTFTSTLLTTITTQGVENKVYYSNEINPSKDSENWTQNYEELETISSYKIVLETLSSGDILKFNYQTETPENLTYNQTIYSNYQVNYIYDNQEQIVESIVEAKTEEKEVIYEDCQTQEVLNSLDIGVYASKGGKQLEENEEVHEGQIIKYSVVLTNNSDKPFENISVNASLINGNFYELRTLQEGEYTGRDDIEFRKYYENTDKENQNYEIEKLDVGEDAIIPIQAVIRNKNENTTNSISANFIINVNEEIIEMSSISNIIKSSKMNIRVSYGGTENIDSNSVSELRLGVYITNIDIDDINNVQFELNVPNLFVVDEKFSTDWDSNLIILSTSEVGNRTIYKFKLKNLEKGKEEEILFIGKFEEIDLELQSTEANFYCTGYYNDEIYLSNNYIRTINQCSTELDVNLTADKEENSYVYDGDEINYNLKISNKGCIDTTVNIVIPMPYGIDYDYIDIYINDEFVENILMEEFYTRLTYTIKAEDVLNLAIRVKVNEEKYTYNQEMIALFAEITSINLESKIVTNEIVYNIENTIIDDSGEDIVLPPDIIEDEIEESDTNDNIYIDEIEDLKESLESDSDKNNSNIEDNEIPNDTENKTDSDKEESDNQNNSANDIENSIPNESPIEKPDSNTNDIQNEIIKNGEISGTVWIDRNKDGLMDNDEKKLSGVIVKLFNNSNELEEKNYIKKLETNNNGNYQFTELESGSYIVLFEYDNETYEVTSYSVNSSEKENSKAISKIINEKQIAITNNLSVDNSKLENINLGLKEKTKFDLKLDKYISTVSIKNPKDNRTTNYSTEKIIKEEITSKYLKGTEITITYNIKITNIGDIAGYVNKLEDYLPEGLEFNQGLNPDWYLNNGILVNTTLSDIELKSGESKNVKLILTKTMTDNSLGTFKNIAGISVSTNSMNEEDCDLNNDQSDVSIVLSVKTGGVIIFTFVLLGILVILGGIYFIKLKKRK